MSRSEIKSEDIPQNWTSGERFLNSIRPNSPTFHSNFDQIIENLVNVEKILGNDENGSDDGPMSTAYALVN